MTRIRVLLFMMKSLLLHFMNYSPAVVCWSLQIYFAPFGLPTESTWLLLLRMSGTPFYSHRLPTVTTSRHPQLTLVTMPVVTLTLTLMHTHNPHRPIKTIQYSQLCTRLVRMLNFMAWLCSKFWSLFFVCVNPSGMGIFSVVRSPLYCIILFKIKASYSFICVTKASYQILITITLLMSYIGSCINNRKQNILRCPA